MTNWIDELTRTANGRNFTSDELDRIIEHARSLPQRFAAARKIEEHQKLLSRAILDALGDDAESWGLSRESFAEDFARNLTALVAAMLLNDLDALDEVISDPLRELANALDILPASFAPLFDAAWQKLGPRLDAEDVSLLGPYFRHAAHALQATERAMALVG